MFCNGLQCLLIPSFFLPSFPCERAESRVRELRHRRALERGQLGTVVGERQQRGVRQVRAVGHAQVRQLGAALGQANQALVLQVPGGKKEGIEQGFTFYVLTW